MTPTSARNSETSPGPRALRGGDCRDAGLARGPGRAIRGLAHRGSPGVRPPRARFPGIDGPAGPGRRTTECDDCSRRCVARWGLPLTPRARERDGGGPPRDRPGLFPCYVDRRSGAAGLGLRRCPARSAFAHAVAGPRRSQGTPARTLVIAKSMAGADDCNFRESSTAGRESQCATAAMAAAIHIRRAAARTQREVVAHVGTTLARAAASAWTSPAELAGARGSATPAIAVPVVCPATPGLWPIARRGPRRGLDAGEDFS